MKKILQVALFAIAATATTTAFAQAYKCRAPNGSTVFSDMPCSGATKTDRAVVDLAPSDAGGSSSYRSVGAARDSALLDAKVAEAVGSGNFALARTLAMTEKHWQMIAAAESRKNAPVVGRTTADVRYEARNSSECRDAKMSYENEASSIMKNTEAINAKRRAMYGACGMDEPTNIEVNNRTTINNSTTNQNNYYRR